MEYTPSKQLKFISTPSINYNVSQELLVLPQYISQMTDYIGVDFSYNLSIVIMPSAFPYNSAAYQKLVFLSKDVLTSDLQLVYPMIGEAIASNWFGQYMKTKNYNETWVNSAMVTFTARKTQYFLS